LPPATQTGANTFGCKVNGEVWVPRVPLLSVTVYDKGAHLSEKNGLGSGIIECRLIENLTDDYFTIAFKPSFFQPRTYQTLSDTAMYLFNPDFTRIHDTYSHIIGDTSNYLTITKIDTTKNFISGIFQGTLYSPDKSKVVKITEGRFDIIYTPQ